MLQLALLVHSCQGIYDLRLPASTHDLHLNLRRQRVQSLQQGHVNEEGGSPLPKPMTVSWAFTGSLWKVRCLKGARHSFSPRREVLRVDSPCRWFTRYSGWGPGQLQRECASGVWFTAAASSAFILQQGEKDRGASGREMWHQV